MLNKTNKFRNKYTIPYMWGKVNTMMNIKRCKKITNVKIWMLQRLHSTTKEFRISLIVIVRWEWIFLELWLKILFKIHIYIRWNLKKKIGTSHQSQVGELLSKRESWSLWWQMTFWDTTKDLGLNIRQKYVKIGKSRETASLGIVVHLLMEYTN